MVTLITAGKQPDAVIFLDGLNDVIQPSSSYYQHPFWTPKFNDLFRNEPNPVEPWYQATNIYRALRWTGLISRVTPIGPGIRKRRWFSSYSMPPDTPKGEVIRKIVDNYLATVRLTHTLCKGMDIRCYFFWQPVPFYRYDRSNDPISDNRSFPLFERAYAFVEKESEATPDLHYLGDLLEGYKGYPFVDAFHYSSAFNRLIASEMLRVIEIPQVVQKELVIR